MKKQRIKKHVVRESKTGKFVVIDKDGRSVTVKASGVRVTAPSSRRAKSSAKSALRYNSNVGFIIENERKESEMAMSVKKKSSSELKKKYDGIKPK